MILMIQKHSQVNVTTNLEILDSPLHIDRLIVEVAACQTMREWPQLWSSDS